MDRKRRWGLAAAAGVLVAAVASVAATPAQDLGLPGLTPPVRAGRITTSAGPPSAPSPKVIDGDPTDWVGKGPRLAGTTVRSAGELIYEDFVFDAYGADDGLGVLLDTVRAPLLDVLPILDRPLRSGLQMAGIATGGYGLDVLPMRVGDSLAPADRPDAADITEVRLAAGSDGSLVVLVRVGQMRAPTETAAVILLDLDGTSNPPRAVPFGTGLTTSRAELAVLVTSAGGRAADLRDGTTRPLNDVAVSADGFANAIEARIPLPSEVRSPRVGLVSGYANGDGTGLLPIGPESTPNVANVAFRREPVSVAMDEAQALMLAAASVDETFIEVDLDALAGGATDRVEIGEGYYEARFTSHTPGVATEALPRQGTEQAYGLYLPSSWRPDRPAPTTLWLHYGAGDTHHLGALSAGLTRDLGEKRGNVLVSPSGRGAYSFYLGAGYADVFEALGDSDRFGRDPDRTSLAGYSMGSYGTMLLSTLHPDLWAGGLGMDGTPPSYFQGWTGNLANAAPVPMVLMSGASYDQMRVDYLTLRDAGATIRHYLYPMEHLVMPAVDVFGELTEALGQPVRNPNPPRVRYTRVPAIETGVSTARVQNPALDQPNPAVVPVDADGAFWVDAIEVRGGDPTRLATMATVDAVTDGLGLQSRRAVPESGLISLGAAWPYVMDGVRYEPTGRPAPRADTFRATMTNVASVRLDLDRMGLCRGAPAVGELATDGPTEVVLHRTSGEVVATVALADAGTHSVEVTCGQLEAEAAVTAAVPTTPTSGARLPATGPTTPLPIAAVLLAAGAALGAARFARLHSRRAGSCRP